MGAGKTTVAQQLSRMTGVQYVDTDLFIENTCKATIKNIFSQQGEQAFRALENSCLRTISQSTLPIIVSSGGGMPCHDDNIALMRRVGLVVYIRLTPISLSSRLRGEVSQRPLLNFLNNQTLDERISELLTARKAFYEQAHITIDADLLTANELAEKIFLLLDQTSTTTGNARGSL